MTETRNLVELWNKMSLVREFDVYVKDFAASKKAEGYMHTAIGQEAVAVGIIGNLHEGDWMTSTYRNHSHGVARGLDIYRMAAEILGRSTGYCKGLGGSMHIADQSINFIGSMGIVAGGIPIAAGAAFAAKYNGTDQIALSFFGDGAVHQGAFHEGLEFAAKFEVPVVYVCENNLYAESTSVDYHLIHDSVIGYVEPYGIRTEKIDGNDIELVAHVGEEVFKWVREHKKPAFIECMTYKLSGQYEGDTQTYKSEAEIAHWKSRDPLLLLQTKILAINPGLLPVLRGLEKSNRDTVDDAFKKAQEDPFPTVEDLYDAVYVKSEAN